eukprot:13155764-Alexandrium_andersonii.AAC.1
MPPWHPVQLGNVGVAPVFEMLLWAEENVLVSQGLLSEPPGLGAENFVRPEVRACVRPPSDRVHLVVE